MVLPLSAETNLPFPIPKILSSPLLHTVYIMPLSQSKDAILGCKGLVASCVASHVAGVYVTYT